MSRIALAMIVRDEVETLPRLLDSIRPFVDQVCVYDTGSTDGTLELLDRLGQEPGTPLMVERGEWRDDFAWARNRSCAMPDSRYEWLVYADGDEIVEGAECLRSLVADAPPDVDGYVAKYIDVGVEGWRTRIVRRGRCRWRGALHEILVPDGDQPASLAFAPETLRWVHLPPDRGDGPLHVDRNLAVLESEIAVCELAGRPLPLLSWFHLGTELARAGRAAEATDALRRFLAEAPPAGAFFRTHRALAHHQLATLELHLGHPEAALDAELAGLDENPGYLYSVAGAAYALAHLDRWDEAARYARRAVENAASPDDLGVDLEQRLRPYVVLAEAATRDGRHDEAAIFVEDVARLAPPLAERLATRCEQVRAATAA